MVIFPLNSLEASLNASSSNNLNHTCAPCPLGASCAGNVEWKDVKAKKGWWRLEDAENRASPPECLNNSNPQPTCAFEECLNPSACQGAVDTVNITGAERCNEENGYANTCSADDETGTERCRLCATCIEGYKRVKNIKCRKCPPPSVNRSYLGVGFLVMSVGCAIMVYMEINSETSDDETSDAVKKVIVSQCTGCSFF